MVGLKAGESKDGEGAKRDHSGHGIVGRRQGQDAAVMDVFEKGSVDGLQLAGRTGIAQVKQEGHDIHEIVWAAIPEGCET